jgi:Inositol hexakisphosphate
MEENFKEDVLREVRASNGRILLHDEVEERPGVFSIVPIWETVTERDIMTPRDVFDMIIQEGFKVRRHSTFMARSDSLCLRLIMIESPL